jgi:hypothetical protein
MERLTHPHSRESNARVDRDTRYRQILDVSTFDGMTDREIAGKLRFADLNMVRPRINELIKSGKLVEGDGTVCAVTNRTVRTTKLPRPPLQMGLDMVGGD